MVHILKTPIAALIPKMVVYVQTKDMAWKVYSHLLSESVARGVIDVYHASLTRETRSRVARDFMSTSSSLKCLVSTVAFGMVCCLFFPPMYLLTMHLTIFRAWMFLTLKLL